MLIDLFLMLMITGVALFLLSALLAPLESLGWWAGWSSRRNDLERAWQQAQARKAAQYQVGASYYVVWLAGVGDISGDMSLPNEIDFLNRLQSLIPQVCIVEDVFPYSVTNNPLTGQRPLAWLWHRLQTLMTQQRENMLLLLIHLRNVLQVAVSADSRYGPLYNAGVAEAILESLLRHGYDLDRPRPITLIGSSGGGQVAIGATTYLRTALQVPITVISIGGVMGSDPGFHYVQHCYYLYSTRDTIAKLGWVLFPGRWPIMKFSSWNQATAAGRLTLLPVGTMQHMGENGYFGAAHVAHITQVVAQLIQGQPASEPHGAG